MGDLTAAARARRPSCAILVDVPDFNLPLARRLKRLGIPIVWYIAPMVWAWRTGRVKALAQLVDRLLCILPFEEAFLRERGVDATYVGSPVRRAGAARTGPPGPFRAALGLEIDRPVLAVLPGSRRSELARLLPALVDVAGGVVSRPARHPDGRAAGAGARSPRWWRRPSRPLGSPLHLVDGRAPEVVGASDVAVVASGTATLEAGLMAPAAHRRVPNERAVLPMGRALVKIPFFCLVNLLAGERVVPELLQGDATAERILSELEPLWEGPARQKCLEGLECVRSMLGPKGAAARAAEAVGSVLDRAPRGVSR